MPNVNKTLGSVSECYKSFNFPQHSCKGDLNTIFHSRNRKNIRLTSQVAAAFLVATIMYSFNKDMGRQRS